jgi:predicted phage terminase large subunit-like protein
MRLIVLAPPRHGKTALVSEFFPAWFLGRNPDKHIISCSYSQTRANDVGRKVRNQLDDRVHRSIFPNCQIADDMKSIQHFSTNQNGEYFSMGVGGSITGRGAHCLVGETVVKTDNGLMNLSEIYDEIKSCGKFIKVLSLDVATGIAEYNNILAILENANDTIYTITTDSGHKVRSTGEHRFFVQGRGYIEAKDLSPGDRLITEKEEALPNMQSSSFEKSNNLQSLLFRGKSSVDISGVRLLRERNIQTSLRDKEVNKKRSRSPLLLKRMFGAAPCYKKFKTLPGMRQDCKTRPSILLPRLPENANCNGKTHAEVRFLRHGVQAYSGKTNTLLQRMRKSGPFLQNDRCNQPKLQGRERERNAVQYDAICGVGTRQGRMLLLRDTSEKRSPCRLGQSQQQPRKLIDALRTSPHATSQIQSSCIRNITIDRSKTERVYDIQVERNSNFFANEILVSNCFLIDDALKDRASAESVLERKKLQTWYRGVAYTRLMIGGRIVIINCVAKGQRVSVENGWKQIEEIEKGDKVWTFDNNQYPILKRVLNTINNGEDDILEIISNSCSVKVNKRHPFLVIKGGLKMACLTQHDVIKSRDWNLEWVPAGDLCEGDTVITLKSTISETLGLYFGIEGIKQINNAGKSEVYDLTVEDTENFIAEGFVVHNTRWHEDDLSGWLLREHASEGWVVLNMPAIAEDNDMLGRKRGEVLWPEAYPLKTLETIKNAIGSYEWNSQYQQRPVSAEGSIIKHEWLRKYDSSKIPTFQKIVLSCDTAFKATELADPTAILVWGVTKTEYYLLDILCRRMEFHELKNTIAMMYQKWSASACLVEDRSSGQSLIQEFKRISPIPVIPIKTMNIDKVTRFSSVSHYFEGGNVLLPTSAPWLVDYETQITTFPYDKHDDMVDATSQFLLWAAKPRYSVTMKPLFWK